MAKRTTSAATPGTLALQRAGIPFDVHQFDHDPAAARFGEEAAAMLGVDAARVFKTLVVSADGRPAVAVVPVARQLSMKAVAAALGAKRCELADQAAAERVTGYVRGGISPFGQKRRLPTVLDDSALAFSTIFVSGGRRGLEIEVAPGDLLRALDASTAEVAA